MAHLHKIRIGWENEQLAHYLLSRFSFVAHPATIGDDLGSDFFCTIFDILESDPPQMAPQLSFAIQVKSNSDAFDASNKIGHLSRLELPYFVGVVDQTLASLSVYSAEALPMAFANFGEPGKLSFRLRDEPARHKSPSDFIDAHGEKPGIGYWDSEPVNRKLVLNCYHVCAFNAREDRLALREKVEQLLTVCRRVSLNIGSRRVEEHLYDWPGGQVTVHAGPGSAEHFRNNLHKRLAEAFCNFSWLLTHDPSRFNHDEFRVYEKCVVDLSRFGVTKAFEYAYKCYVDTCILIDDSFHRVIE
ncbi:MAG: hypothetical protein JST93_11095 [Acidobacteria bacterium]|nr:hypothetical protein [Acidobacteriota bacterium]